MHRFKVPAFNAHYEGSYDARELEWRRLGAIDKAANIGVLLGSAEVSRVLEVGCGTGAVLAALAARGLGQELSGVDLADPGAHRDPAAAAFDLRAYDGEHIPFPDNSFDLVFASHVLEHVAHPRALLLEMLRVSARYLYLEVPCELHLKTSRQDLQQTLNIGHINAFTPESFQLLLETAGLHLEKMQLFDVSRELLAFDASGPSAYAKHLVRQALLKVSPVLASRLLTYHCGALAGKQKVTSS